ncbi:MAG: M23 family metallopeptidase [Sphingobacteriales bacterium]|nr:MAG: M23 family metallopeptidase [Sphingobacteriales bacterium]
MRFSLFSLLSFLLYMGFAKNAFAQEPIPMDYFRSPINEKIELAGNFGELRPNHFHTGIDIKICGVEGLPIYAVADGYISRMAVSPVGYGNALYINHPNGYTTVYGHLYKFGNEYAKYMRQMQYQTQNFEQDIFPGAERFPVKKGDLIGFGGNSGGSAGAHLHFEVRETKSEKPVNPLHFGFDLLDTVSPVIRSIKIYPLEKNSFIQVNFTTKKIIKGYEGQTIKLDAFKYKGNYYLKSVASIQAHGPIGFAVEADDYIQGVSNKLGIFSVELCINSQRQYYHQMQKLDFSKKRYINAHTDFTEKMQSGRWYQKSFIGENNQLPIYNGLQNNGVINYSTGNNYNMAYYLTDASGNLSALTFKVTPVDEQVNPKNTDSLQNSLTRIPFNEPYSFANENFSVKIPQNTFYEDVFYTYKTSPKKPRVFSEIYEIGSPKIPVHDFFEIAIKADDLPARLAEKACILSMSTGYLGGNLQNGWLQAKSRTLGKFYISADTVSPVIVPINIKAAGSNLWASSGIRFKISDNMSGIKSYRGKIDGNWVLFQYDAKSALIYYLFDENCPPGNHSLEMEITDQKNNVRRWSATFFR